MRIAHAALWVRDLEAMRAFYESRFGGVSGKKYENPAKGFESYFISFESGARLELMRKAGGGYDSPSDGVELAPGDRERAGLAHLAFSAGSRARVDAMTAELAGSGIAVLSGPRTTGDGYYESLILDPEGNRIEITE